MPLEAGVGHAVRGVSSCNNYTWNNPDGLTLGSGSRHLGRILSVASGPFLAVETSGTRLVRESRFLDTSNVVM